MKFRDDDISLDTRLAELEAVHEKFIMYNTMHTVAVIAEGLNKRMDLVEYLRGPLFDVQLHCQIHHDLTKVTDDNRLKEELEYGCRMIQTLFGSRPSILYPPWNKSDKRVSEIAASIGLIIKKEKVSLQQYIRLNGESDADVNFHYWDKTEAGLIEQALRIYKTKEICQLP